ncbi:hypothetical protein FIA58_012490 [Flavobacterium jejuense]|uniref:Uncharacterized protein n=1 Tax=Flavobacterium jejuense TaxID=1544455 RepID=A0ABX0ISF8_9FLAO|nr:hypothetical protein [Flavobacterium jejuense]NHN26496.1 hypothetical protein [Flavobacterium jejuense]
MNKVKIIFLLLICVLPLITFTQIDNTNCDLLHNGTFIYFYNNEKIKVTINENNHTEYHENGKYVIHSKLFWINDCEFVATCVKTTIPKPFYRVDDQMHVKVNRIYKNEIYFTSSINRNEWSGKLVRID